MLQIIDAEAVRTRLSMSRCIDVMADAMKAIASRSVSMPARTIMPLFDGSGILASMPASVASPRICGAKLVTYLPDNASRSKPPLQGFIALFDEAGTPLAIVDGGSITTLRTAAATALATRVLARHDSHTLGILGCGVQAASHLEAICAVRRIEEVYVWGREFQKARAFALRFSKLKTPKVTAVDSVEEAARCDIVCTVTGAQSPVLCGEWLTPGAHVNLVGAHSPTAREADSGLIAGSRVFVDSLAGALTEAGDLLIPIDEGVITESHILGEIGEVVLGSISGRTRPEEITVYKSLGLAVQDLFAAYAVFKANSVAAPNGLIHAIFS